MLLNLLLQASRFESVAFYVRASNMFAHPNRAHGSLFKCKWAPQPTNPLSPLTAEMDSSGSLTNSSVTSVRNVPFKRADMSERENIVFNMHWSPSGRYLVYISNERGGASSVQVAALRPPPQLHDASAAAPVGSETAAAATASASGPKATEDRRLEVVQRFEPNCMSAHASAHADPEYRVQWTCASVGESVSVTAQVLMSGCCWWFSPRASTIEGIRVCCCCGGWSRVRRLLLSTLQQLAAPAQRKRSVIGSYVTSLSACVTLLRCPTRERSATSATAGWRLTHRVASWNSARIQCSSTAYWRKKQISQSDRQRSRGRRRRCSRRTPVCWCSQV